MGLNLSPSIIKGEIEDKNLVTIIVNEPVVQVKIYDEETGVTYYGRAKCCPKDEYDMNIGFEIAYLRAMMEKCKHDLQLLT